MKCFFYLFLLCLIGCDNPSKTSVQSTASISPDTIILKTFVSKKYNQSFNNRLINCIHAYLDMKNALVVYHDHQSFGHLDSTTTIFYKAINHLYYSVYLHSNKVYFINAKQQIKNITIICLNMRKDTTIYNKRAKFALLSTKLYTCMKALHFDGAVLYYQYCPMALADKGAYWLNGDSTITNPYFGSRMLTCGVVKDSINFTKQGEE